MLKNKKPMSLWEFTLAVIDMCNINKLEFANKLGWSREVMGDYMEGDLTEEMAAKLEEVFGVSKYTWKRINKEFLKRGL